MSRASAIRRGLQARAVGEQQPDVVLADIQMPPTKTDEGISWPLSYGRLTPGRRAS